MITRLIQMVPLKVCLSGHAVENGKPFIVEQLFNCCGHWANGNFCGQCGSKLNHKNVMVSKPFIISQFDKS